MSDKAFEVGNALYRSGCLKFGSFRIKSGVLSPYYIDLACLLSSPKDFCTLVSVASDRIEKLAASKRVDKLASIELKGALLLPSIGCQTNLPCVVVRKEEKTYGAIGRIAGASVAKGENILFFDDVVSEGLSKLEGIKLLEQLGAKVENVVVVVDREQGGTKNLEKLGYQVCALARISELVDCLLQSGHISQELGRDIGDYLKRT